MPPNFQVIRLQRAAGQSRRSRLLDARRRNKKVVSLAQFRKMTGPQRRRADVRTWDDGTRFKSVRRVENLYLKRQRGKSGN